MSKRISSPPCRALPPERVQLRFCAWSSGSFRARSVSDGSAAPVAYAPGSEKNSPRSYGTAPPWASARTPNAVLLFLDRLPLYTWEPAAALSDVQLLSVCFPLLVTDPHTTPQPRARPRRWGLDTRFTGEAYAWRHHPVEAGLNPDE